MNIWIYEKGTHTPLGIVDSVLDMRGVSAFQECDELQLKLFAPRSLAVVPEVILWPEGYENAFIVEQVEVEDNADGAIKLVTAYGGESVLCRRLLTGVKTYSGTCGLVIKAMLDDVFAEAERRFPNWSYQIDTSIGEQITYQTSAMELFEAIANVCKAGGIGMRCVFDPFSRAYVFSIYEGNDRTASRTGITAVFDPLYENIVDMRFTDSVQDMANVAYVLGERVNEDSEERKQEIVPLTDKPTGYDRWETLVESSATSKTGTITYYDPAVDDFVTRPMESPDYPKILQDAGMAELERRKRVVTAEGDLLLSNKLMRYGDEFTLGDIVTVRNSAWGMAADARIVEVEENHSEGQKTVSVTIGDRVPTIIDAIKKL